MHATRSRPALTRAAACIALLSTAAAVHAEPLELFVDDDAPAGGDGMSWQTAFRDLQDAVDVAYQDAISNPNQRDRIIRIGGGVYVPGRGSLDRASTFQLLSSTSLIGGYAGFGGADPGYRDPAQFVSVLSGDLAGNDAPDFVNRSDNTHHVVTVYAGDSWSHLDGLTVRGGAPGAIWPDYVGAGVLVLGNGRGASIVDCVVRDNWSAYGGGIGAVHGDIWVLRTVITGNRGTWRGGGIFMKSGVIRESRVVANDVFVDDYAMGGGIFIDGGQSQIVNSVISGNVGKRFGGGIAAIDATLDLVSCTFAGNTAEAGRAMFVDGLMEAWIFSSIFANSGGNLDELTTFWRARFGVVGSIVEGGMSPFMLVSGLEFGDLRNVDTSPRFADPLGLDGVAGTLDDDLRPAPGSPAIDDGYVYEPVWPGLEQGHDVAGMPRVHDDLGMYNTGYGGTRAMDVGAYEFQGLTCTADHNADGTVDVTDIFALLSDYFAWRIEADFDRNGGFSTDDIFAFLAAWFAGC